MSKKTTSKIVPFFPNHENSYCFEAVLKMVLSFFLPSQTFTWKQLEKITGKNNGCWTWPTQAILKLKKFGFDVELYQQFDHKSFAKMGVKYIKEKYGETIAQEQQRNCDLKYEMVVSEQLVKTHHTNIVTPNYNTIDTVLKQGYLIICNVNSKALVNCKGYAGHFVLVYGIDENNIHFHDPGLPPRKSCKYSINDFDLAWSYPDIASRNIIAIKKRAGQ